MIKKIEILNFKKHEKKEIVFNEKITLIHGRNGSGKTSILEALSLFTAGKGIFNLQNDNLILNGKNYFSIQIKTNDTNYQVKYINKKKSILINSSNALSSNLLEHISILGLTPYSSLAFWQDVSLRRKIINRIILQHYPLFGKYYNQYNTALKQRNLMLQNGTFNNKWKTILDPIIKENGLKINDIRKTVLTNILKNIQKEIKNFLKDEISIIIYPTFEKQAEILNKPLDDNFLGPHISKFTITTTTNLALSTGQQRKLLLSFILMSLNLNKDKVNILLLDDVLTNLDEETIFELLNLLDSQNIQTLITNVSKISYKKLNNIELF